MRRLFLAALIFVAIGPALGARQVRPVVDTASQDIAVHALGYPAGRAGALRFVRGWRLSSSNAMFGGFSSLAVTGPDRFQLVADNGYWARFAVLPGDRVGVLMGNTPRHGHVAYVGVVAACLPDAQQRDAAFGPRNRIVLNTGAALGDVQPTPFALIGGGLRIAAGIMTAKLRRQAPSLFFDMSGQPHRTAHPLSARDRRAPRPEPA